MVPVSIAFSNKNPERYFGVDYILKPFFGSHPSRRYFSTTADLDPSFSREPIRPKVELIKTIEQFLEGLLPGKIIGLVQNPDPYDPKNADNEYLRSLLNIVKERKLGLYLETASDLIFQDLPLIKEITANAPVLITVPIGFLNDSIQSIILPDDPGLAKKMRLIQKINQEKIPVGVILKPIIPFVNDTENNILEIIEKSKSAGAAFIYPSFGITLSPTQRQAFMELITRELPGLRNILMDQFGLKKSWASPEQKQLKKAFVINMKKNKLPFGMKDIIGSTKETNVQLKLF
ncbi:MAG: hypothetical protein PHI01_02295 [Candidatus Izemoplasmatales bacterium]|nr:hypothetical protein [Candidatus Izemoplasmatales bacterium]